MRMGERWVGWDVPCGFSSSSLGSVGSGRSTSITLVQSAFTYDTKYTFRRAWFETLEAYTPFVVEAVRLLEYHLARSVPRRPSLIDRWRLTWMDEGYLSSPKLRPTEE